MAGVLYPYRCNDAGDDDEHIFEFNLQCQEHEYQPVSKCCSLASRAIHDCFLHANKAPIWQPPANSFVSRHPVWWYCLTLFSGWKFHNNVIHLVTAVNLLHCNQFKKYQQQDGSGNTAQNICIPYTNTLQEKITLDSPLLLPAVFAKVMERMVNNKLVWYLERNKLITPIQSGFCKGRSTTDQLVRLESFIREAFVHRQHFTAIFFDLEKAYDTTWKLGILKDLHDAGLRGSLPLFIAGFLADRKFQVRVGGSYSKPCNQEMGVPQGSILSVTLFCSKSI